MLKQRLLKTTPFLILYAVGLLYILFEVVFNSGLERWGVVTIYSVLPFLLFTFLVDVILKIVLKTKLLWIWMIELTLLLGLVYYWIIT